MIRSICTKAVAMAALVAGLVLLPSAKAEATFAAYICDVQNCTSGTVLSATSTTGFINLDNGGPLNPIGGMSVTVNTALSQPVLSQPTIDMTFTAATTAGSPTGSVWLYVTDSNFSVIAPLVGAISNTFIGGSGTLEAFVYGGSTNTQSPYFPTSPLLGTSGLISGSNLFVSGTTFAAGLPTVSPYSYTLGLHITRTGAGSTTGNFGVTGTPIPEPATLSLLGLGLTGIGAAIRRRRKARQNA